LRPRSAAPSDASNGESNKATGDAYLHFAIWLRTCRASWGNQQRKVLEELESFSQGRGIAPYGWVWAQQYASRQSGNCKAHIWSTPLIARLPVKNSASLRGLAGQS